MSTNPFLATPSAVLVVRHVRLTVAGELVAEDPAALVRHLLRHASYVPITTRVRPIAAFHVRPGIEVMRLTLGQELFRIPAYRAGLPRAAYVQPRIEPGGVALNTIELNGVDFSDTRGYAVLWTVPAPPSEAPVPRDTVDPE